MSVPYSYKALIDEPPAETPCKCGGGCGWVGAFSALAEIGDCSLTPGDPSPAGRCPECESLAYVKETPDGRLVAAASELWALVREVAVPGGISPNEFSRPNGWLERATAALAKVQL